MKIDRIRASIGAFSVCAMALITALSGCSREALAPHESSSVPPKAEVELGDDVIDDVIRIKVTPELASELRGIGADDQPVDLRSIPCSDLRSLSSLGAKTIRPVFPLEARFEKRMKRAGLHLWYDLQLDPRSDTASATRAISSLQDIPGVTQIERVPRYGRQGSLDNMPFSMVRNSESRPDRVQYPFNDPELYKQWHYFNVGANLKSQKGADINLFDAWKRETGSPDVIVAVIDGGVFYKHEDLAQNIWTNPSPGTSGPYVNDLHGYNFADNTADIVFDAHGTHVAGVIAAVNNNGIGVCGVAGGDGSPDSGARIMVCDAFGAHEGQAFERAFVYAANHGAVIAQNSWGGAKFMSPSLKDAIDYFITYAGCDDEGNQLPTSPMKGGVVLFAAGNESSDEITYPAAYGPVISISGMAPDWKKAYYTNRGPWVDLMCPGGDLHYPGGQIYSTSVAVKKDEAGHILSAQDKYEYMQGTSMACPHASGVAALIVSHFGGQGYTRQMCERNLLTALRPMDIDMVNPSAIGILGQGYLDADRALDVDGMKSPNAPQDVRIVSGYRDLKIIFTAVADEDDKTAASYLLYFTDKEPLTKDTFRGVRSTKYSGLGYQKGDPVTIECNDLAINHTYYYAVVSRDRWGHESEPVFFSAHTLNNSAPQLSMSEKKIRLTGSETDVLEVKVTDPEGHSWQYTTRGDRIGVEDERRDDVVLLHFSARGSIGEHHFTLIVTDQYGASSEVPIGFEVYANASPVLLKPIILQYMPLGSPTRINLPDHFSDADGHQIAYSVSSSSPSVLAASLDADGRLTLTPSSKGKSAVQIRASDTQGGEIYTTLQVTVVDDLLVYHVYPVPTYGDLHVVLADKAKDASVYVVSGEGADVFSKKGLSAGDHTLDLTRLSGGSYLLVVECNGERYTRSFVKY